MPDRFATLLTCIDGRIQHPLNDWTKTALSVDYVDTVTTPGPESKVTTMDHPDLAALVSNVQISQQAHGSGVLVIAAHSDCAGNPVPHDTQRGQLHLAAARLGHLLPGTRILAVHIEPCGHDRWNPQLIAEIAPPTAVEV